jgi:uncharacterized protein HemX
MTEPPVSQTIVIPDAATSPPPPRRGKGVWVAAVAVVLVLLAGGGLGAYFVKYRSDSDAALADQQSQITELEQRVEAHQHTLDGKASQLRDSQGAAEAAKKRVADLDKCPGAVQAVVDSIKNTNSLPTSLVLAMVQVCGVSL